MMEADGQKPISTLLALRNRILPTECVHFCPYCVEEDRKQFGECYWHRVHQIPGVEVCPFHNIDLQNCRMHITEASNVFEYFSAERMLGTISCVNSKKTNTCDNELLKIAQDALWLLHNHNLAASLPSVQKKYLILLADHGLATYKGNKIYTSKLLQAFQQEYPSDLLKRLHCELSEFIHDNWVARLPHMANQVKHPVQHLLFIHFLGHAIETFLDLPTEQKPFGTGPWPCLNPICEHYRERQIQACEVIYSSAKDGLPRGKFSCECGFTYSRIGPDRSEEDHFQASHVKLFGSRWEAKLRELLEDPTISKRQSTRILGVSARTLERQTKKLGWSLPRSWGQSALSQKVQSSSNVHAVNVPDPVMQAKYRSIWLSTVEECQEEGVKQIKSRIPGVHKWLYNHDREWLRSHTLIRKQNQLRKHPLTTLLDWKRRDEEFAIEVRTSALRIKMDSEHPVRLSIASITREMSHRIIISHNLNRLPLTAQALAAFTETNEAFAIRRVQCLAGCYQQENICPTRGQFLRRGWLWLPQKRWVSVKNAIDDALKMLSAGIT